MEMKKKRILKAVSLLLCVVMVCTCIPGTVVQAKTKSSVTVYRSFGDSISTFSKKNGKLTVKTDWPFDKWTLGKDNYTDTKKKTLSYPLAKNCKWTCYDVGESKPRAKTSYKSLKKEISEEHKAYLKYGEYDSPTAVWILVKNKKIIEVRTVNS